MHDLQLVPAYLADDRARAGRSRTRPPLKRIRGARDDEAPSWGLAEDIQLLSELHPGANSARHTALRQGHRHASFSDIVGAVQRLRAHAVADLLVGGTDTTAI